MDFAEFIRSHEGDDLAELALARGRYLPSFPSFDLALTTLEVRRKLRGKVPEWYANPSLRFPYRLAGEQCSSSVTARYKARVLAGVLPASARIADLTGGMGVDTWAFAQVFAQVLYNEMRPELADATAFNLNELGVKNVIVRNGMLASAATITVATSPSVPVMAGPDRPSPARTVAEILDGFRPDALFLDPARRASDGRKVFRLEDCEPDVLQLLPELLSACPILLLKLSPMADISLVCKQLGCVKELHVVAAEGECKELLLLLERGYEGPCATTVFESGAVLRLDQVQSSFEPASEMAAGLPEMAAGPALAIPEGSVLFEPGKALLKAGAFDLPCRYGLEKLGRHTHLYVGPEVPEALQPFGKVFEIQEFVPLNNRSIKDIGKRYPRADVTARNIPLTSDQLRKKLGVRSGGGVHIFGVHVDALDGNFMCVAST